MTFDQHSQTQLKQNIRFCLAEVREHGSVLLCPRNGVFIKCFHLFYLEICR